VDKQRQKYKRGEIAEEQEKMLREIGFEWVRGKTPNRDYFKHKNDKETSISGVDEKEIEQGNDNDSDEPLEQEETEPSYRDTKEQSFHNTNARYGRYSNSQPSYSMNDGQSLYQRYWS
jgi:hypothetical protein